MTFSSFLRLLVVLGIVILGPVYYFAISYAQIKPDKVLNKLDANYYYPQKKGLINITARLEWEQQDLALDKKAIEQQMQEFENETGEESTQQYLIAKSKMEALEATHYGKM